MSETINPDRHRINLASERLGASALTANDEFFAPKENLVADAPAIFLPDKYVPTGKWMDGWETRRRREPGHDWCIVRLGMRGTVTGVVVDTAFFRGNFPAECALEACDARAQTSVTELCSDGVQWRELVPRSPLAGDTKNTLQPFPLGPVTHLRLRIYPDGGVARLRAWGDPEPDWAWLDASGGLTDLAALENGGRVIDCSDSFFGEPLNMLMPGTAADMSSGWETRRRRGPGHDWSVIRLGAPGSILRAVVDTSHFKGNSPGTCAIEVIEAPGATADQLREHTGWKPLLARTPLLPHTVHAFGDELEVVDAAVTHARINIYPDGGIARLRLWGRTARAERLAAGLARMNHLPSGERHEAFLACCASTSWASQMASAPAFSSVTALLRAADRVWRAADRKDWLEAFAAHPKIGEKKASGWAKGEQSGVATASQQALDELAERNREYEARFGFIFIICATGRSANEMLGELRRRLTTDPDTEIRTAAEEQRKITRLRLEKWLSQ